MYYVSNHVLIVPFLVLLLVDSNQVFELDEVLSSPIYFPAAVKHYISSFAYNGDLSKNAF